METWNESRIRQMIADKIEESLVLDYKQADSLSKTDGKKKEIAKDVSAFANSAGGTIIYGIAEDTSNRHLPGTIVPVNRNEFSKEWLEHVIRNIRPRIYGVIIHPVAIGASEIDVVYVVEIPASDTAHQSTDHRYYRRYNFESVPMEDHEIRDVMGRRQNPKVVIEFSIEYHRRKKSSGYDWGMINRPINETVVEEYTLNVFGANTGAVLASTVSAYIILPIVIVPQAIQSQGHIVNLDGRAYWRTRVRNVRRDIIGFHGEGTFSRPNYGPERYVPILPETSEFFTDFTLADNFTPHGFAESVLYWETRADNSPLVQGNVLINQIPVKME